MGWLIMAVLFLAYYIVCVSHAGVSAAFSLFWLIATTISLLLFGIRLLGKKGILVLPGWCKITFWVIIGIGFVYFIVLEVLVIGGMCSEAQNGCDYIVVLGAKTKENGVSKTLKRRLDTAIEYYENNKNAQIIVAGGKGDDEPVTEALAMKEYLIKNGIAENKIIMEDKSTDTNENFRNVKSIFEAGKVDYSNIRIAVVTSDFHIYRSLRLAKTCGFNNAFGVKAPSDEILLVNCMVREAIGITKDLVQGNIK